MEMGVKGSAMAISGLPAVLPANARTSSNRASCAAKTLVSLLLSLASTPKTAQHRLRHRVDDLCFESWPHKTKLKNRTPLLFVLPTPPTMMLKQIYTAPTLGTPRSRRPAVIVTHATFGGLGERLAPPRPTAPGPRKSVLPLLSELVEIQVRSSPKPSHSGIPLSSRPAPPLAPLK